MVCAPEDEHQGHASGPSLTAEARGKLAAHEAFPP